jgi:hypothetical protein
MMMMMIMSMERYHVSELRLPMDLLLITQVINEHREPYWNDDVDREKLLIRPPELSVSPTSRIVW